MWRFEVSEKTILFTFRGWNAIVANQRLGKDQDLAAVGGIRQRFGISYKGCGEYRFAGDVRLRTERLAAKDRSVLP